MITADDSPCQTGGSGVIRVWKGTGAQPANASVPTAFAEQDAGAHPTSAGSGSCVFSSGVTSVLLSPDSRLDAAGTVHLAYIDGKNGTVYYQTFFTGTNTWGPRTAIATRRADELGLGVAARRTGRADARRLGRPARALRELGRDRARRPRPAAAGPRPSPSRPAPTSCTRRS